MSPWLCLIDRIRSQGDESGSLRAKQSLAGGKLGLWGLLAVTQMAVAS